MVLIFKNNFVFKSQAQIIFYYLAKRTLKDIFLNENKNYFKLRSFFKNKNYFKLYVWILWSIYFFFSFRSHYYLTLKWKQIIIPTLHFHIHPNTKIRIIKSIPIEGEIGMKRKFPFPFLIPMYQTWPQCYST